MLIQPAERVNQLHLFDCAAGDASSLATMGQTLYAGEGNIQAVLLPRNSMLRGSSSALDVTMEISAMDTSRLCNLSTMPTFGGAGQGKRRARMHKGVYIVVDAVSYSLRSVAGELFHPGAGAPLGPAAFRCSSARHQGR